MNTSCKLFGHKWKAGKCQRCGEVHSEHQWAQPDDKCKIVCTVCGAETYSHDWDGCLCHRCGKKRGEEHDWDGCLCRRCGATRSEGHDWDACTCRRCGQKRSEHRWERVEGTCSVRCAVCGTERLSHDWDGCRCRICGRQQDSGHRWEPVPGKCAERCAACGTEHPVKHTFAPVPDKCEEMCTVCGQTCESHRWQEGRCSLCGLDSEQFAQRCAKRLADIYARNPGGLSRGKPEQRDAEDIGEALDAAGGMRLMLRAHSLFVSLDRNGNGRNLEMIWDGIGDWRG